MKPGTIYQNWFLWLLRNCADCAVKPCPEYERKRCEIVFISRDMWGEPNCEQKVQV